MFRRIDRPDDTPRATRVRNLVSRGTMLVVGVAMLYLSLRGFMRLVDTTAAGDMSAVRINGRGRRSLDVAVILLWAGTIALALLGLVTTVAAALTRRSMERLFELWSKPPVTGERDSDRLEPGDFTYRGRWWWRW